MRRVTVQKGQTVWDVALRYMGSPESVFEILALNPNLRPDQAFEYYQEVFVPEIAANPLVVAYYEQNKINPRTGDE